MKQEFNDIVILTGAGISADSGIATFRATDGLWEQHRVEDVATPEGFKRNPELVQKFYNERRRQLFEPDIQPNPAHFALAKLQKQHHGIVTIITQNVDNLHERGGAQSIMHMHGELLKVRCIRCKKVYLWEGDLLSTDLCPCCSQTHTLRPHIVWFGEMPFYLTNIEEALQKASLFVAIGTSGNVYPAAGFVQTANYLNIPTLEMNLDPGVNQSLFRQSIYGRASETVPQWVESILNK